jgi:hypothetical protein
LMIIGNATAQAPGTSHPWLGTHGFKVLLPS